MDLTEYTDGMSIMDDEQEMDFDQHPNSHQAIVSADSLLASASNVDLPNQDFHWVEDPLRFHEEMEVLVASGFLDGCFDFGNKNRQLPGGSGGHGVVPIAPKPQHKQLPGGSSGRGVVPIAPKPQLWKEKRQDMLDGSPVPSKKLGLVGPRMKQDTSPAIFLKIIPYNGAEQRPVAKPRPKSSQTCLRCRVFRKKCSGGVPCNRCKQLWGNQESRRGTKLALQWRVCFDSNILELNYFSKASEVMYSLAEFTEEKLRLRGTTPAVLLPDQMTSKQFADLFEDVAKIAGTLQHWVAMTALETNIGKYLGFIMLALRQKPNVRKKPHLVTSGIDSVLEWGSFDPAYLVPSKLSPRTGTKKCSLAWIFSVTMLAVTTLETKVKGNVSRVRAFAVWLSNHFFQTTFDLISLPEEKLGDRRTELIQNLNVLFIMAKHLQMTSWFIRRHEIEVNLGDSALVKTYTKQRHLLTKEDFAKEEFTGRLASLEELLEMLPGKKQQTSIFGKSASQRIEANNHLAAYTLHWLCKLDAQHFIGEAALLDCLHLNILARPTLEKPEYIFGWLPDTGSSIKDARELLIQQEIPEEDVDIYDMALQHLVQKFRHAPIESHPRGELFGADAVVFCLYELFKADEPICRERVMDYLQKL